MNPTFGHLFLRCSFEIIPSLKSFSASIAFMSIMEIHNQQIWTEKVKKAIYLTELNLIESNIHDYCLH